MGVQLACRRILGLACWLAVPAGCSCKVGPEHAGALEYHCALAVVAQPPPWVRARLLALRSCCGSQVRQRLEEARQKKKGGGDSDAAAVPDGERGWRV